MSYIKSCPIKLCLWFCKLYGNSQTLFKTCEPSENNLNGMGLLPGHSSAQTNYQINNVAIPNLVRFVSHNVYI
jgi:hypothetical protein